MKTIIAIMLCAMACADADAVTQYKRIVGISEDLSIPTPPTFSIIVAEDAGMVLVLSQDGFPQGQSVYWEGVDWSLFSFTADEGDTVNVFVDKLSAPGNLIGFYDTTDADGNSVRGTYNVTVLPYNLLVQEAPTAQLAARVAPTGQVNALAKQLAKKMRARIKRHG